VTLTENFSCDEIHLDSIPWFSQHRSRSHVPCARCNVRRTTWLCLRFTLCVITRQNATFWGVAHPQRRLWPQNSAEIFVQCTYPQVPSSYVYSFGSYRVDKQTHKHTNKQMPPKASNVLRYATMLGENSFGNT